MLTGRTTDLELYATAGDAMITDFATLPVTATIRDGVEALLRTSQEDFPVVDGWGRPTGLLTRALVLAALKETDEDTPVAGVMQDPGGVARATESLQSALETLQKSKRPAIGVLDADGKLIGLLSNTNIMEMMMIRAARPDFRFARRKNA